MRDLGPWDFENEGELEATLSGHTKPVRSLAAALGSSKLLSCAADGTVGTWDTRTGLCEGSTPPETDAH